MVQVSGGKKTKTIFARWKTANCAPRRSSAQTSITHRSLPSRGQTSPAGRAYLAALLCKESAIVAPALLLLVDVFQYRTFSQKRYSGPYLFYGAMTLAYLGWRYYVLGAF